MERVLEGKQAEGLRDTRMRCWGGGIPSGGSLLYLCSWRKGHRYSPLLLLALSLMKAFELP